MTKCYLVAKDFRSHGCIAFPTEFGDKLKQLSDYLTSQTLGSGIQILAINSIEGYPEYKPYEIIKDKRIFCEKVKEMMPTL